MMHIGMEIELLAFLPLALDGSELSVLHFNHFNPKEKDLTTH